MFHVYLLKFCMCIYSYLLSISITQQSTKRFYGGLREREESDVIEQASKHARTQASERERERNLPILQQRVRGAALRRAPQKAQAEAK
jgi:hypothetical protein